MIASAVASRSMRFKPIPDEEGTETRNPAANCRSTTSCFKPIPDEEGTETAIRRAARNVHAQASNRSPMRRGLKHANRVA